MILICEYKKIVMKIVNRINVTFACY